MDSLIKKARESSGSKAPHDGADAHDKRSVSPTGSASSSTSCSSDSNDSAVSTWLEVRSSTSSPAAEGRPAGAASRQRPGCFCLCRCAYLELVADSRTASRTGKPWRWRWDRVLLVSSAAQQARARLQRAEDRSSSSPPLSHAPRRVRVQG